MTDKVLRVAVVHSDELHDFERVANREGYKVESDQRNSLIDLTLDELIAGGLYLINASGDVVHFVDVIEY